MALLTSIIEKTGRYGFLLVSLCAMIGLKPFLDDWIESVLLTDIFFTGILISGLYALDREPVVFRRACWLMVGIVILKMLYHVIGTMSGSSMDGLDIAYCTFQETGGKWTYEINS